MVFKTTGSTSGGRKLFLVGTSLCLLISSTMPLSASAFSIPGMSSKKSDFQLPTNGKLDLEQAVEPVKEEKKSSELDLSPLKLDDTASNAADADKNNTDAVADADTTGTKDDTGKSKEVLNASVTATTFVPKGPLEGNDNLLAPTSVKGTKVESVESLGGSLLDQAQSVNAAPLPLIESAQESCTKLDAKRELERQQLTALWEATLTRSPDINFVLQKLLPATNSSKVTTVMMRALSTAAFGALGTFSAVAPGPGSYMTQNLGYSVISQLLQVQDSKAQKKARLTQTEAIMLYDMIRETANKLVIAYRDYKNQHEHVFKTNSDLEDLKNMAKTLDPKTAADQLKTIYTLRQAQREAEKEGAELSKLRQILVDLAGADSVAKLDTEIDQEFRQIHPELFLPLDGNQEGSPEQTTNTMLATPAAEVTASKPAEEAVSPAVEAETEKTDDAGESKVAATDSSQSL